MSFVTALREARVVAILRRRDIDEVVEDLADQLFAAGVRAAEITLDQPGALQALERLLARAPDDAVIGAGTVMTVDQLDHAADLGVRFVVCPHLDVELITRALERGIDILPGVATPTELVTARRAGASAVKLFPAGPLTPAYLRVLRGPFPDAAVVPTGGIALQEVGDWLDAGAVAVGLGSAIGGIDGIAPQVADVLRGDR